MPGYELRVDDKRWKKIVPTHKKLMDKAVSAIPGLKGTVNVLLTNDDEIRQLNRDFRGKDKPTNVLSFPSGEDEFLGDIAMALETLEREAKSEEKTIEDHFTHLFIHGVLHLMGYDHELGKAEQDEMEAIEIETLAKLGISNPYSY